MKPFWNRGRVILYSAMFTVVSLGALYYYDRLVLSPQRNQYWCQSHMKGLAWATNMYVQDYDDKIPPAERWAESLTSYTGKYSFRAFQCPAYERPVGFAMHSGLEKRLISSFKQPSKTVAFFDADSYSFMPSDWGESLPEKPRHPAGHSILFLDGHSELLHKPDFKYGYIIQDKP